MKKDYINPIVLSYIVPVEMLCAGNGVYAPKDANIIDEAPARKLYV